jgi:hypothetical protein
MRTISCSFDNNQFKFKARSCFVKIECITRELNHSITFIKENITQFNSSKKKSLNLIPILDYISSPKLTMKLKTPQPPINSSSQQVLNK